MSDYTSKLNLYKVDPAIDGEDTFNIKSMMNDNWDKIDEKVGNMDEKLSGVEDNANNYNHPDTHDADMIRIKDEGGKFTGDNVEDALGEVGSQLADIANEVSTKASQTGNTKTIDFIQKDNGDSGTSKTIDWTQSNKQNIIISSNTTLTFLPPNNTCNLVLVIGYTGAYAVTLPTHKTVGGEPLEFSNANAKTDILTLYYDGTNYYCMLSADWK